MPKIIKKQKRKAKAVNYQLKYLFYVIFSVKLILQFFDEVVNSMWVMKLEDTGCSLFNLSSSFIEVFSEQFS